LSADQPHLAHHFADLEQQHDAATLGMWAFLATEVLFFGSVLTAYTVYRSRFPHEFEAMSKHLRMDLGTVNTFVLLSSSFTVVMALHGAKTGRKGLTQLFLAATLVLGLVFLGIKFAEYKIDWDESLIPNFKYDPENWPAELSPRVGELFLSFYFILTGLHAVHMLVGIGVLLWVLSEALRDRFGPRRYTPVEVFGLYWHFVDIVWIFLFPLLYLVRV
jgi:cytochrome c oxidase subunit III